MSIESWKAFVEAVRDRSSLLDVVREGSREGRTSGRIIWFTAPWRSSEQDPSLAVYYRDDRWHDFGEGVGGDVFSFVERRDGCDFKTALQALARRAGVEYERTEKDAEDAQAIESRHAVTVLQTRIQALLHRCLPSAARAHLRSHYGLTDETIDLEQIGYCPGGFVEAAKEELGASDEDLLATGFFVQTFSSSAPLRVAPLFPLRIVFPYWSRGSVVFAIGRLWPFDYAKGSARLQGEPLPLVTIEEHDRAKYKKLLVARPERPEIHPSIHNEWFWGEDHLRSAKEWCVFTEGITDAIALVQAGIPAASFVTTQHREADVPKVVRLTRHLGRVYICNDADVLSDGKKPGLQGALKTASVLVAAGKDVRIVVLPKPDGAAKIDVNEYLRDEARAGRDPGESFRSLLPQAKTIAAVLLDEIPVDVDPKDLDALLLDVAESSTSMGVVEEDRMAKEVKKRFKLPKSHFHNLVRQVRQKQKESEEEKKKDDPLPSSSPRSSGKAEKLRGAVREDLGFYFVPFESHDEVISNFSLNPKAIVVHETGNLLQADVLFRDGHPTIEHTFPKTAWSSVQAFRSSFPTPEMAFMGSSENVQTILSLTTKKALLRVQGTNVLGVHKTEEGYRFIAPDGRVMDEDGKSQRNLIYIPRRNHLQNRVSYKEKSEEELKTLAKEVLPLLLEVNTPGVALPILSHCLATMWKQVVQDVLGHFPILNVVGGKGSGKTSLITRVFWRLQGAKGGESFSCTETPFVLLRLLSTTNATWMVFDEFKPSDMGKPKVENFVRHVRRAYSGDVEARGKQDLSDVEFPLVAPLVVMGEAPFDDPAIHERILGVTPSAVDLRKDKYREAFHRLEVLPIHDLALPYITWSMRAFRYAEEWLRQAKEYAKEIVRVRTYLPPRVVDNVTVYLFGIRLLEEWSGTFGIDVGNEAVGEEALSVLLGEVEQNTAPEKVADVFDRFLEEFSLMAEQGILKVGEHFWYRENKLSINLEAVHRIYLMERKKMGLEDATNGIRALRLTVASKARTLRETGSGYVLNERERVRFGNGPIPWCVTVDISRVPDDLQFLPPGKPGPVVPKDAPN